MEKTERGEGAFMLDPGTKRVSDLVLHARRCSRPCFPTPCSLHLECVSVSSDLSTIKAQNVRGSPQEQLIHITMSSTAGTRRPRQITPTSPSPSPEPQPGATNGSSSTINVAVPSASAPAQVAPSQVAAAAATPVDAAEAVRINLETRVRSVVDLLYQLAVCSADVQEGSQHLVANKVNECIQALAALDATKDELHRAHMMIPQDVLEMLDTGKNPDIHTRNFVNRLASENQYSYGQHRAVERYKATLDAALDQAFPELKAAQAESTETK